MTIRHPALVRKLVAASASFAYAGTHPELLGMIKNATPEIGTRGSALTVRTAVPA